MQRTYYYWLIAAVALTACLPPASLAQGLTGEEVEAHPADPAASGLSDLDPAHRLEFEDAVKRRDYKKAETILLGEIERDPKTPRSARLLVLAAGLFFLDGQYLNSTIAWKKAEAITPLDDRSRFTLAMAYIRLNRRDWAMLELEKLVAAQPRNALYAYWVARLDYDAQNYAAAIAQFQKVIEVDPGMMRAYDGLGLCYDYLGRSDDAIRSFHQAIELNRRQSKPSPWPHLDLAVSLITRNQLGEAEQSLREALRYDAQLPQAHYQLGRILEMRGEYPAAMEALARAAAEDTTYAEPHFLLGRIYHRLGENAPAKQEIERFQRLKQAAEAPANTDLSRQSR